MSENGGSPQLQADSPRPSHDGRPPSQPRNPQPRQPTGRVRRRRFSSRAILSAFLIVVGCVLAPLSVVAVWTASEVSNTSRYVATMEPLVHNPAIQNALTNKITTEITARLNVTHVTDEAAALLSGKGFTRAGPLVKSLAPSLSSAVTGFVHSSVHKIVTGPRFARAWVRVNTAVHTVLVKALSGQGGGAVSTTNGHVTVDLGALIAVAKQDLIARGFKLAKSIPTIHPSPTLTLFSSKYLAKAQQGYRLLNDLKIVLPILSLLLIAGGVGVARRRRRSLVGAGLGVAASMLVLAAGLAIFRALYLTSVPPSALPGDAAAALFDTLVRFIKDSLRVVLVVALIVAIGAFFTGPASAAVRTRGFFRSGLGWIRSSGEHAGLRTGPAGRWTYTHRAVLRISAVGLAALIFVFLGHPTVVSAVVIASLLVVVLALIELVGRPPVQPNVASH